MANNSKVSEGLYLVKLRNSGAGGSDASFACTVPRALAEEAGMRPGDGFVAVRTIGPCVILSRAIYATSADAQAEADRNFDKAVAEWSKRKS